MVARRLSPKWVFALGFAVGFIFTAFLPLIYGSVFAFLGLGSLGLSFLALSVIFGILGGTLSGLAILVLFLVWRGIPKNVQLVLIAMVLVVGLVLFQPELDLLALLALLLTALGVSSSRK